MIPEGFVLEPVSEDEILSFVGKHFPYHFEEKFQDFEIPYLDILSNYFGDRVHYDLTKSDDL